METPKWRSHSLASPATSRVAGAGRGRVVVKWSPLLDLPGQHRSARGKRGERSGNQAHLHHERLTEKLSAARARTRCSASRTRLTRKAPINHNLGICGRLLIFYEQPRQYVKTCSFLDFTSAASFPVRQTLAARAARGGFFRCAASCCRVGRGVVSLAYTFCLFSLSIYIYMYILHVCIDLIHPYVPRWV